MKKKIKENTKVKLKKTLNKLLAYVEYGCNLMEWLTNNDYIALNTFIESLDDMLSKVNISKKLSNRLRGIFPEIYTVIELHKQFPRWKVTWKGGTTKGIDIILEDEAGKQHEIQVKKMTNVHTRGRGKNKIKLSYYWQNREVKSVISPWVLVYINEISKKEKPIFFCVPKEEMKKLMDEAKEKREEVKKSRLGRGDIEGNPMIRIELHFDNARYKGHKQPLNLASTYQNNWNGLFK